PMFPALALVLGLELTRLSARTLMWIASPLAVGGTVAAIVLAVGWNQFIASWASKDTPAEIYRMFMPWGLAAIVPYALGGILSFLFFRDGRAGAKSGGIAALALSSLVAMQFAFVGHDAFAQVRSAAPILAAAQRTNGGPLDASYPVYQVASYDQTLP